MSGVTNGVSLIAVSIRSRRVLIPSEPVGREDADDVPAGIIAAAVVGAGFAVAQGPCVCG